VKKVCSPGESEVYLMIKIREEISNEIKDMTYAEERAFLDKLLQKKYSKYNQ
jgi:hypothetical protein